MSQKQFLVAVGDLIALTRTRLPLRRDLRARAKKYASRLRRRQGITLTRRPDA